MNSMDFEVKKYNQYLQKDWNFLINSSKNSHFFFNREFMDYHSDRFIDHSLIIYNEKGNPICLFPANEKNSEIIVAHNGLTFGSFIFKSDIKLIVSLEIIKKILSYFSECGYKKLRYKAFPRIYNSIPSDEVDYALFITEAKLIRRDTALVISNSNKIDYAGNIRRESKKAEMAGCMVIESEDFKTFWLDVLVPNLKERFGVAPVHSTDEIVLLKSRFPENIRLYLIISKEGKILAGTVFFVTENVAHCQYIASSDEGRKSGALNYLFIHLINNTYKDKAYFDFGIVNEKDGTYINKGMLGWKERMGGRTISHDFYEIDTSNWTNIDQLLDDD